MDAVRCAVLRWMAWPPATAAEAPLSPSTSTPALLPDAPPQDTWEAGRAHARLLARGRAGLSDCTPQQMERFPVLRALAAPILQARDAMVTRRDFAPLRSLATRMEDELTCPVDHSLMRHPAGLSCGHLFETELLARLTALTSREAELRCPLCRAPGEIIAAPDPLHAMLRAVRAFNTELGTPAEATDSEAA